MALMFVLTIAVLLQEAKPPRFGVPSAEGVEVGGSLFLQEYIIIGLLVVTILRSGKTTFCGRGVAHARLVAIVMAFWNIVVLLGATFFELPVADGAWGNVRMLAEGLVAFLVVTSVRWRVAVVARLLFSFVCVMILHSVVLWVDFVNPGSLPFETVILYGGPEPRLSGLFLQPSRTGFMLAIALVFDLSLLSSREGRWRRFIGIVGVPILFTGILLTQTRGSILAACIGLLYVFWQLKSYAWLIAMGVLGFVVASWGVIIKLSILRLGLARFTSTADSSGTGRSEVYAQVGEFIADYPLGGGAGSLYHFSGFMKVPHAHNMYLQIAVMFGIPGLLLFLYWIGVVLRVSSWPRSAVDAGPRQAAWLGLRSGLVVALIAFMTEPFLITNVGLWFWVISGLLVALHGSNQGERATSVRSS